MQIKFHKEIGRSNNIYFRLLADPDLLFAII